MIFIIAFSVLLVDQLTKLIVSKNILLNETIPVIDNVFHLTLIHNKGAAFGVFKNQTAFFIAISLITIFMIGHKLRVRNTSRIDTLGLSLTLILSGAVGNFIDRICFGYVVDFLDFRIWPVFNIADSAITIGAVLLGYCLLKKTKK